MSLAIQRFKEPSLSLPLRGGSLVLPDRIPATIVEQVLVLVLDQHGIDAAAGVLQRAFGPEHDHFPLRRVPLHRGLPVETVEQWLAHNLPTNLQTLLEQILPGGQGPMQDEMYDDLVELVRQRRVIRLAELAERLDRDVEEVQACLERHPDQFAMLEGPAPVAFEVVSNASES